MEFMMCIVMLLSIFNFVMLYRLMSKRQTTTDTALYEEQIKSLKKIVRLNEKCLKITKEAQNEKNMEQTRTEKKSGMVPPEIERRVY